MNEFDAMRILGEANPVQAQDLAPLESPARVTQRRLNRRLVAAIAIAAVAAAALAGVFAFNGSDPVRGGFGHIHHQGPTGANGPTGVYGLQGPSGENGPTGGRGRGDVPHPTGGDPPPPIDPTTAFYTAGPTGANGPASWPGGTAEPTSLADAREAFKPALVLPDIPPVDPSHIDKVVKDCGEIPRDSGCDIGIGFLEQRVWIFYQPAAQWSGSSDPLAVYKRAVTNGSSARIVDLSGTPALLDTRHAQFVIDGVRVLMWVVDPVPSGGPTLEAIAQSIVDGSK